MTQNYPTFTHRIHKGGRMMWQATCPSLELTATSASSEWQALNWLYAEIEDALVEMEAK